MVKFRPDPKPLKKEKPKQGLRRTIPPKSVSPTTQGEKVQQTEREVAKTNTFKPKWDHMTIMKWFYSQPDKCYECGGRIGAYNPKKVHHLVPQRLWKHYSIDIINDTNNMVKLGWRYECNCHEKAEGGNAPKTKSLAGKRKDEYTIYRIK